MKISKRAKTRAKPVCEITVLDGIFSTFFSEIIVENNIQIIY